MKGYSTREVAEVLGVPSSRILSWTRTGLLTPERGDGGSYVFSFQDIVLLRTARELLDGEIPARKVRSALEALREQLPVGRPLSAVHISAVGDRVLVRDDETTWEPDSGQIQLDFAVAEVAKQVEPLARRALSQATDDPDMTADDWYDTALDLEAVASDRAEEAYRRALAIDPEHADALLNLGRVLHEAGRLTEAEQCYAASATAAPEDPRPVYNLGVVLEDMGRADEAIAAYERAIGLDGDLGAAHFNVARLLSAAGRRADGLRHLKEYKRLLARGDAPGP